MEQPTPPGAPLMVRGVAYSGASGSMIASVEVSVDDGSTWLAADVLHDETIKDDSTQFHGWVRWECAVDMKCTTKPTDLQQIAILCRATAADGTTQPQVGAPNGGYLYNGYHKMIVPCR